MAPRPIEPLVFACFERWARRTCVVLFGLSCWSCSTGQPVQRPLAPSEAAEETPTASEGDGDASGCVPSTEAGLLEPEPLDLGCADETVEPDPARSAAVSRLLENARTAQREERFDEAVAGFEQAHRSATNDAGVLGELGWASYLAGLQCEERLAAGDPDDGCGGQMERAVEALSEALDLPASAERRGTLLYHHGRVHLHMGDLDRAEDALQRSVCVRSNEPAREALAEVWVHQAIRAWESGSGAEAVSALTAAGQLDPARAEAAARARVAWYGPLQLRSMAPERVVLHETLEALCEGNPCELLGGWIELDGWDLGHLRIEMGIDQAEHLLVARTTSGVSVATSLGYDHGVSRRGTGYVRDTFIEPVDGAPFPTASVVFTAGAATAEGCDWVTEAWSTMLFCTPQRGGAHCFAHAKLGPEPFESDSLLPTVQQSLGACPDYPVPKPRELDIVPSFEVHSTGRELVMESATGRRWCVPLRDALCGGAHAPAACGEG